MPGRALAWLFGVLLEKSPGQLTSSTVNPPLCQKWLTLSLPQMTTNTPEVLVLSMSLHLGWAQCAMISHMVKSKSVKLFRSMAILWGRKKRPFGLELAPKSKVLSV